MVDWCVVALWGGAVFGATFVATGGSFGRPSTPWRAQALGFLTMTAPVALYFAFCESSTARASIGKRALGLVVRTGLDGKPSFRVALLRNAIKFSPWECGHLVAQQAIYSGDGGFAPWVWAPAAVAFLGPVWWIASIVATGVAPYDRWTNVRVGRMRR
jgi:uncharacterized RDD family membrane protein YckC